VYSRQNTDPKAEDPGPGYVRLPVRGSPITDFGSSSEAPNSISPTNDFQGRCKRSRASKTHRERVRSLVKAVRDLQLIVRDPGCRTRAVLVLCGVPCFLNAGITCNVSPCLQPNVYRINASLSVFQGQNFLNLGTRYVYLRRVDEVRSHHTCSARYIE
jgi:hypothetical protein